MKILLAVILLTLILLTAAAAYGQTKENAAPNKPATRLDDSSEAKEAFEDFDFGKLVINPNNLTEKNIEELRDDFLGEVKPYLIDAGEYPARLARIAATIFLFHKAGKSRTAVFRHRTPTVFTWKETFVTFSTEALDILTDDEVAALVAHETGHLYFAQALAEARANEDDRAARVIELKCDLAALVTLSKLNVKPSALISAVKKLIEKRRELQIGGFQAGSPSLENRQKIYELYVSSSKK